MYYRPGVMALMHDYVANVTEDLEDGDDAVVLGAKISEPSDQTNRFRAIDFDNYGLLEDTKLVENYMLARNKDINTLRSQPDGRGDYFVNYNRIPGFPITENKSSMFVADGRISLDDISGFFQSALQSLFESGTDTVQTRFAPAAEKLFQNIQGTLAANTATGPVRNYKLFYDITKGNKNDLAEAHAEFDISSIREFIDNSAIEENMLAGLRSAQEIDKVADMMRRTLEHYIERCGTHSNFQVLNENVHFGGLFEESWRISHLLEFMNRYLSVVRRQDLDPAIKLTLLYLLSSYDFAKNSLSIFSNTSRIVQNREEIENEWAKICLYYLHIVFSILHTPSRYRGLFSSRSTDLSGNVPAETLETFFGLELLYEELPSSPNYYPNADGPVRDAYIMLTNLITEPRGRHGRGDLGRIWLFDVTEHAEARFKVTGVKLNHGNGEGRVEERLKPRNGGKISIQDMSVYLPGGQYNEISRWQKIGEGNTYRPYVKYPTASDIIRATETLQQFWLSRDVDGPDGDDLFGAFFGLQEAGNTIEEARQSISSGLENLYHIAKRKEWAGYPGWNIRFNNPTIAGNTSFLRPHRRDELRYDENGRPTSAAGSRVQQAYDRYGTFIDVSDQAKIRQAVSLTNQLNNPFKANTVYSADRFFTIDQGRVEDILQKIDIRTYFELDHDQYFKNYMNQKGYSVSPDDRVGDSTTITDRTDRRRQYAGNLYRNTLMADRGLFAAFGNKAQTFLKKSPDRAGLNDTTAHQFYLESIRNRWNTAVDTYSDLNNTIVRAIFNSVARIGQNIVKGVLEKSTIDQVARLVYNSPNPYQGTEQQIEALETFLDSVVGKTISGEQRSILMMKADSAQSADRISQNTILSIPVSEFRSPISKYGTGTTDDILIDCFNLSQFKQKFMDRTSWMSEELINRNESKMYLKYIFPAKRFQALASIFSTTTLSSFSTMPTLMETPKTSLAFLMNITSMNSKDRVQMVNNMSQAEFFKALKDNGASDPRSLKCFDLPFTTEFIDQFMSMLLEAIQQFPSLLFRGIASVIDPAYKEMKSHWENCDIKDLKMSAIGIPKRPDKRPKLIAGATNVQEDPLKDSKYAPLFLSTLGHTAYGIANIFNGTKGVRALGYMAQSLTGYIYKGPQSLLDSSFQFSIPCLGEEDPNLDKLGALAEPFDLGRYGHPLSPLTFLALSTAELKGDKRLREMSGACTDNDPEIVSRQNINDKGECNVEEDSPFGGMPTPEDFEE
jgi:hypothetical protein